MNLTAKIKLLPDTEQEALIVQTLKEYVRTVNAVVDDMIDYDQHYRFTSKMIEARLPACLKNQAAGDALSIDKKIFKQHCRRPVLKKLCAIWNNQNFKVNEDSISFPVYDEFSKTKISSKRITVKAAVPSEVYVMFQDTNLGAMRITIKNGKFVAQIAYEPTTETCDDTGVMGVDLGIKCPAVSVSDKGKVKFFGNGRKNKYIKRHYKYKRQKLMKRHKLNAVKKLEDKEQRVLKDIDHKLSREIVNYAKQNGIGTIKLETLAGIRRTTRQSWKNIKKPKGKVKALKNELSVNSWSFYRLQQFIKYKAELAGIEVIEVNPAFTSQICPDCGKLNKAEDRTYECSCGYRGHRDVIGALNILHA